MSNLIITVISIALVAVAALTAAWFGGQAFMEGNVQAEVNTLISNAEQIAGAWRSWAAISNGGSPKLSDVRWYDQTTDFVPQYLSSIPELKRVVTNCGGGLDNTIGHWFPIDRNDGHRGNNAYGSTCGYWNSGSTTDPNSMMMIFNNDTAYSFKICTKLATMAGDSSVPPIYPSTGFAADMQGKTFRCFFYDANNNGTRDTGENQFYLIYSVF